MASKLSPEQASLFSSRRSVLTDQIGQSEMTVDLLIKNVVDELDESNERRQNRPTGDLRNFEKSQQ